MAKWKPSLMCLPGIAQGIGGSLWLLSALMFAVTSRKGSTTLKSIPHLIHNLNHFIRKPANVSGLAAFFLCLIFSFETQMFVCACVCTYLFTSLNVTTGLRYYRIHLSSETVIVVVDKIMPHTPQHVQVLIPGTSECATFHGRKGSAV